MASTNPSLVHPSALQARPAGRSEAGAQPTTIPARQTATVGLATIYLLVAYEWLVSGLDKLLNAGFPTGLGKELEDSLADNSNRWYVHLMRRFVLPHASTMAVLVQWAELAVGLGLVFGALRWLAGGRIGPNLGRLLDGALIAALAGGALMTVNYWLLAGNTLPWINSGNAFDEGISLDGLLSLVSFALLAIQIHAMRVARREPA